MKLKGIRDKIDMVNDCIFIIDVTFKRVLLLPYYAKMTNLDSKFVGEKFEGPMLKTQ